MRVLVVGAGGREHALVRTLLRSPQAPEVLCAPGNAGIRRDAAPLEAPDDDPAALARAARAAGVDLVVVGPEAPLVAGLADALAEAGVRCFGPRAVNARLEGSKAYAKEIMAAAGVATGGHAVVGDVGAGLAAITGYPAVIKADGLAAGKGVVIAADEAEARAALEEMLVARRFGDAPVVVEEFLAGEELSLLALCDGERALPLAPARDYKRIGDGDRGPNTGGMGSYSPVAGTDELVREAIATVHQPVVDELARRGTPFHGVLYAGLMLGPDGVRVLEFNVRFGDPETQVVLPRLRSDLVALLDAAADHRRAGRRDPRLGPARGGLRRARLARLPRVPLRGRRHRRAGPGAARGRGLPRGHGGARRRGGHRGRPRARGDGTRRRPAGGARRRLCCRRHDHLRRRAGAQGHRRMTEQERGHAQGTETVTEPAPETEFDELAVDAPRVGIVMGSKSDMPAMEAAAKELEARGILHEVRVMSAHRDPEVVADYAKNARLRGLRVIIAGAGLSAALPGVVAAHTPLPVIGVPLTSSKSIAGGLDALLSIAQMPPGVPVACVGVDSAKNAAVLAARILDA